MDSIISLFLNLLFFKEFKEDEVYNEFSLQHELGIYLRENLQKHGNFKFNLRKIHWMY